MNVNSEFVDSCLYNSKSIQITCICLFLVLSTIISSNARAKDLADSNLHTFSMYLENDYFAGKDGGYSNGLKLTWSSSIKDEYPKDVWPHRWLYPLVKHIPFETNPDRKKNITIAFGQNIYTPDNIEAEKVVPGDRPYAGITYLSLGFHSRLERKMDSMEVSLGLVGPNSYAEQCQKAVHRVFDDIQPKGWDNQLNNEPVLEIVYEHKKKIIQTGTTGGFGQDLILNTGAGLGNALTYYNLGLAYRIGWNMPNDFGNFPIRPISSFNGSFDEKDPRSSKNGKFGIQLFASIEGRAVLHNIFLDGNTFTDSYHVNKKPVVGDFVTGIDVSMGSAQLSCALVHRSKEYETQSKAQKFASFNISISY